MQELSLALETIETAGKQVAILRLSGYLDTYTAPKFMIALQKQIDEGAAHVILDMGELDYMSSAGFGILAGASHRLADKAGKLIVAGLSDKLQTVFDSLGLSEMVATADSRQDAIDEIG